MHKFIYSVIKFYYFAAIRNCIEELYFQTHNDTKNSLNSDTLSKKAKRSTYQANADKVMSLQENDGVKIFFLTSIPNCRRAICSMKKQISGNKTG